MSWDKDQEFEKKWWGSCENTFQEEIKQLTYGYKMGLQCYSSWEKWPCYNLEGRSVLDIGGGPVSMLLKCENRGDCVILDPCEYPEWVIKRYDLAKIDYIQERGEDLVAENSWDEVWIYNVLQHTQNPELIIQNAKKAGSLIRIFEWIDKPPHLGHPQELKEEALDKWLDGKGITENLDENGCYGRAFYGVFGY